MQVRSCRYWQNMRRNFYWPKEENESDKSWQVKDPNLERLQLHADWNFSQAHFAFYSWVFSGDLALQ
jgi:hypothetical protein